MRQITVVDGHPDPSEARLNHALADCYAYAARAAGHEVRRVTIAQLQIPVLRKPEDFYGKDAPEELREAQRDIAWADHLVFFYPLWHGNMPSLLKAFIEQVFRPGFAMDYGGKNRFPKQLFKGKTARIVVTMGMPAFAYRALFGAYGVKSFERSTLALCGVGPISETLLGGVGDSRAHSNKLLGLMEQLAQEDGAPEIARRRELFSRTAKAALLLAGSYAAYVLLASTSKGWLREPSADGKSDGQAAAAPQSGVDRFTRT